MTDLSNANRSNPTVSRDTIDAELRNNLGMTEEFGGFVGDLIEAGRIPPVEQWEDTEQVQRIIRFHRDALEEGIHPLSDYGPLKDGGVTQMNEIAAAKAEGTLPESVAFLPIAACGDDTLCVSLDRNYPNCTILHSPAGTIEAQFESYEDFEDWDRGDIAASVSARLELIKESERYQEGISWGTARPGHPEGTIKAHIAEIETNIETLAAEELIDECDVKVLQLLAHTHDTFKGESKRGFSIKDPESHASLASAFVGEIYHGGPRAEYFQAMLQYHDEPYAIWKRSQTDPDRASERLEQLIDTIEDWDTFAAFVIVDGCTGGKDLAPLKWFFSAIEDHVEFVRVDPVELLEALP